MKDIKVDYIRRKIAWGKPGKDTYRNVSNGGSDGENTVFVTWAMSTLGKSDNFAESYIVKSTDGGQSFSEPSLIHVPTHHENGVRFSFRDCAYFYSKKHNKWFVFGSSMDYDENDSNIRKNGIILATPCFTFLNPETCDYEGGIIELPFPYEYLSVMVNAQPIEYENGDVLLTFYYITEENHHASTISVRYSFDGEKFTIVKAGTPIDGRYYARGIYEPSIAKLNDKYYITLRTDEMGMLASSGDGFTFTEPKPWRFDDGSLIGNHNTQQHWVRFKDALYLVYNRKNEYNDHIFRHRAPVFMARFDEERECLIKASEVILIPEMGAQMGNFVVLDMGDDKALHINCECMDNAVACDDMWYNTARYGADNVIWAVDIFETE